MPPKSSNPFLNHSLVYLHQTKISSQIIYSVTLLAVLATLCALPFLYTTVGVKGMGMMQSSIEKVELLAPANGRLMQCNLRDNQKVSKGATLLVIDAALPQQQNTLLANHHQNLQQLQADAKILLAFKVNPQLKTGMYQASYQQYAEALQSASNAMKHQKAIFERYETLFNKRVISVSEFEQYKFNYQQAQSELEMVHKKYKSQWQNELHQYQNQLREVQNQQLQNQEQQKQYRLRATVGGSVQNLSGMQVGAYVYANQKIGEISPDSALLAYCYIKPSDIGLIRKGQAVRLQIDAFNYNQWGMVEAKVLDIADDIVIQNQTPFFKVKCQLQKDYLQLKNGYKGVVKKGMTFRAHFTVARRSLYQLLYDKIDDWMNPMTAK